MCACVAFGCTSRPSKKIPGITFHSFPKNEERRLLWIKAVHRKNWAPSRHSRLCSKHFPTEMFDRSSLCNVRLRENAIPTIFESFPSYLQQTKNDFPLNGLKNKTSDVFCSVLTPLPEAEGILPDKRDKYEEIEAGIDSPYAVTCRDIYLGGTRKPSTWREDVAIPLLKKKGLTYFLPQDGIRMEGLIPIEATNIENSQVLLFVIKNDSSSLEDMILASHYIGLGCQVVLCIQYIPDDVEINDEKLSVQAVKDYNRGRVYLSDLATRAGVPVFSEIDEAVNCAISFCSKIS